MAVKSKAVDHERERAVLTKKAEKAFKSWDDCFNSLQVAIMLMINHRLGRPGVPDESPLGAHIESLIDDVQVTVSPWDGHKDVYLEVKRGVIIVRLRLEGKLIRFHQEFEHGQWPILEDNLRGDLERTAYGLRLRKIKRRKARLTPRGVEMGPRD